LPGLPPHLGSAVRLGAGLIAIRRRLDIAGNASQGDDASVCPTGVP
jgi:hypothetical protein